MEQFRIEIADQGKGHFYNIKALGSAKYQIYQEEEFIGTIQLDESEHNIARLKVAKWTCR